MTVPPGLSVPRYGDAALADVGPSLLAALGLPDERNPLGVADTARACLFLVDGLGWQLLRRHPEDAPFLTSLGGQALTAGFPSTTVTSLSSIGTGLPPGEHAFTGYTSYLDDLDEVVNWLAWKPIGRGDDLRDRLVPEVVQPAPTIWERAADAGVATTICTYDHFNGTGLTRAVLRGGRWGGTYTEGDAIARAGEAMQLGHRALVFVYVSALDLVGHMRGPQDEAWHGQLAIVDRIAERLAAALPGDGALFVTADHGMVLVPEEAKVDADALPDLQQGVVAIAGEPRMRHVHCQPGAAADVAAAWRATLGRDWLVLDRDAAVAARLFGPTVTAAAHRRIGDVLALALGSGGVVERRRQPRMSAMPGHHGSLTDDELLVPWLEARRR